MRGLARLISSAIRSCAKIGPLEEAEGAAAVCTLVEDFRAQDVGGHQVGRELHAPRIETQNDAERFHELRLCKPGHADEKAVAAGQERHEGQVDDLLLPEDDRVDGFAGPPDGLKRRFRTPDDCVVERGRRLSNAGRHEVLLNAPCSLPSVETGMQVGRSAAVGARANWTAQPVRLWCGESNSPFECVDPAFPVFPSRLRHD